MSGIDSSSDAVGGEGFTNFGDVQFVQDQSVERYLEAAKLVADYALMGAGPLAFSPDAGRTGLEISALNRINELYATKGFRVVSGEGGRPFGLDRYGKAFYVAWHYKHRVALGDPSATIRGLAAKEGITGRFADHIWTVVNTPAPKYPARETIDRWKRLPAPTADVTASIATARAACDEIYKASDDVAELVFRARRSRGRRRRRRKPAGLRRHDARGRPGAQVHLRPGRARRARARPGGACSGRGVRHDRLSDVHQPQSHAGRDAGRDLAQSARGVPARQGARGANAAVLSTQPLRAVLPPAAAAALAFGTSPDGAAIGPDDFATTGTVSFTVEVPAGPNQLEFQADAELGKDRNAVIRLMISDRAEGSSRDALQRVLLGDPKSAGYEAFRAGMAEYVAALPPNSHGEANPADKDPVPAPFDNTYNSPEHDAFVMSVKYQRNDAFFTANMVDGDDRARLNQAWNDLFGSWPYHDAYLGLLADHYKLSLKSRHVRDLDAAQIAALPAEARPHFQALRTHYDAVMKAQASAEPGQVTDALAFASRAWRRPLTAAEQAGLRTFYQERRRRDRLDHEAALRALIARVLVSPAFLYRVETAARGTEQPLTGWELASRLSFFLWSSVPDDELRRAAAAGELSQPTLLAKQVRRMTADPKARRVATEFFGQWLGFYQFDEYRGVDTGRFPEFTDEVRSAMYDEAVSTFEYIVRQDRPVQRDPRRRLHLPEQAARQVLRHRGGPAIRR